MNVLAMFNTCRAFLPGMQRANRGHIVNIGSVMGLMSVAKLSDYCASKWAVLGFHEAMCLELDEYTGAYACRRMKHVCGCFPL